MKTLIRRGFISAFVYATFLILFQYVFTLDSTNIRISTFLAPIFGIMWGPVGAIGVGIGNLISDTFSPNFHLDIAAMRYVFGSMGNALMSFLSYIMWHTIFLKPHENPFEVNVKNIMRYIFIQLIVTVVTSLYLTLMTSHHSFKSMWDFTSMIMINNWDVNILIGLPVLLMLMSNNYPFYRPEARQILKLSGRAFNIILVTLVITAAYVVSLDIQTFNEMLTERRILALTFFIYLLRPIPKTIQVKNLLSQPIYYRIAKGFCMFMVCMTVILSGNSFLSMSGGNYSSGEIWMEFYENTFLILHFTIVIQLVLIWYIEKNIVSPLTSITKTASKIIRSDPEKDKIKFEIVKSGDEIELLSTTLHKMLESIYKYMDDLRATLSERARTNTQLEIAANIQASLLPSPRIINEKFDKIRVESLMQPALMVGGDFYDFKAMDDDHIFLVCSDISDKGISASLFMTMTYTLIHHKLTIRKDLSLTDIFYQTNNQLCENNENEMFATAVGAIYEISTGKLTYINAGHTSPLIVHKDGRAEFLKKRSGAILGSMEDIPYKTLETTLTSGDILVLYSDGVSEALNDNEEFFMEERLAKSVSKLVLENNTSNVVGSIYEDLKKFVGEHYQSDDITIVVLVVK